MPNVERIPLATYRKISEFAAKGGKVIFHQATAGDGAGLARERRTRRRFANFRQSSSSPKRRNLADALHAASAGRFHRAARRRRGASQLPYSDVYFIANTTNRAVKGTAAFRVQGMQAAWWDPFTGKTSKAEMTLDLAPYESRVLGLLKRSIAGHPRDEQPRDSPVDVSTNWSVKFPDAPAVQMNALKPWTDDEARKFYSGTATYERTVAAPPAMLRPGQRVFLNFGEGTVVDPASNVARRPACARGWRVRCARRRRCSSTERRQARSGRRRIEVEVTGLLKSGDNAIRVVVANLGAERAGQGPLPDYKELIAKYGEKIPAAGYAEREARCPAGMLGPVKLVRGSYSGQPGVCAPSDYCWQQPCP